MTDHNVVCIGIVFHKICSAKCRTIHVSSPLSRINSCGKSASVTQTAIYSF